MFEFIFGLVWILFCLPFIFFLFTDILSVGFSSGVILFCIFTGLFVSIGLFMMFIGLKKISINKKTDKNGFITYAIVTDTYESGSYVNDNPEWKSNFKVVDRNSLLVDCSEIVGFDRNKYPIGSYVRVKYYNGDINILEAVPELQIGNMALLDYKKIVDANIINKQNETINCAPEIVIINNIKYKRADLYDGPQIDDTIIDGVAYKRTN